MALYDRDYMRDDSPSLGERLRRIQAFQWFFWANIAVFAVQWLVLADAGSDRPYIPAGGVSIQALAEGKVWTPFTYMFVHGSVGHILLNMIMLWFAGKRVQDIYGQRHFVMIYVLSGLAGAALQLAVASATVAGDAYLMGASASIMGLLLAFAVAMPQEEVCLLLMFVIPVRFRLWSLARVLLIFNLGMGTLDLFGLLPGWLSGGGAPVAYLAHFGGAVAGWYYARSQGYGGIFPGWEAGSRPYRSAVRRPAMALPQRRRLVEQDEEAVARRAPSSQSTDLMRDEVDPILDKINEHGLASLTEEERRTLERASRRFSGQ